MADLITLDFETYFDTNYSLSKMSTEAYIRDPQFKVHGVGIKVGENPAIWVPEEECVLALEALDIPNSAVLAHHAQFDGFILAEHYNLRPKIWFDTLSMGRAIVGAEVGGSLKKLTEHYGLGAKGDELMSVKGIRDLTKYQSTVLGEYCKNDVELTYKLFMAMQGELPKSELKLIDSIIRMFTEPMLRLDYTLLKDSLEEIQANKLSLLLQAGVGKDELMSNAKFAELLSIFGVNPPMKISPRTGKATYAFAKTDEAMKALLEHDDERVQALVAARMGVKSTIAETRTEAFMGISRRGAAPVYLKYSGAGQTHRLSGGDKVNWQNLGRGSKLRDAVMAPDGMKLVVVDSSNIESRVLDYLAGEKRALEAYRANDEGRGPDIYCFTAELIYGRSIDKVNDPDERFLGKVAKLGLGYGMGKEKFYATLKQWGVPGASEELAIMGVNAYRNSHQNVVKLWGRFDTIISNIVDGRPAFVDPHNLLAVRKGYVELPNGLRLKYPDLKHHAELGWTFAGGYGGKERVKLYGGKGIENCVQALARLIVMEQSQKLAKKYPWVLSVHDEAVFCVPEAQADDCLAEAIEVFRTSPSWAPDLPLNAAGDTAARYGEAK